MPQLIEVVDYDPIWPDLFAQVEERLRGALGPIALRVDHIGSTAVPGLAAKPVIDIQISVTGFDPIEAFKAPLEAVGFLHRADNPELTKRYFREMPGQRRTHIHVRRAGSFSEQFALLFPAYLRAHPEEAAGYGVVKRRLAVAYRHDRRAYVAAKEPSIWEIIRRADEWAQRVGWSADS